MLHACALGEHKGPPGPLRTFGGRSGIQSIDGGTLKKQRCCSSYNRSSKLLREQQQQQQQQQKGRAFAVAALFSGVTQWSWGRACCCCCITPRALLLLQQLLQQQLHLLLMALRVLLLLLLLLLVFGVLQEEGLASWGAPYCRLSANHCCYLFLVS